MFFYADGVRTDPHGQADHFGLIHDIVVETWSDVHTHWPHFLVLWIAIRVNFWLRVAIAFATTVTASTRRSAATGPVHTCHVEVDVIRDFDVGILFLDPFIGPEITPPLSTFLTRPEAEHHGVPSLVVGHRFSHGQHHAGARRVVVGTDSRTVGSSEKVGVKQGCICRWSDVKVSTEHHPFVRIHFTVTVSTDVVGLRILCSGG